MAGLVLPRIRRVRLSGFHPLFDRTVDLQLPVGPFLLLGGNAMGKTTTLQAIIFALAGGTHDDIEIDRRARWDVRHFRQAVNRDQLTEIEVNFDLRNTRIAVRRGIKSDAVLGFKVDTDKWVQEVDDLDQRYEDAVVDNGEYQTFEDFRYLVHRVLYLPETRQSLIWDHKAQLRAVMLICSDPKRETRFRDLNRRLRNIDTEKRHLHVDIGRLQKRIERYSQSQPESMETEEESSFEPIRLASEKIGEALQEIVRHRMKLTAQTRTTRAQLVATNNSLEQLQEKLSSVEDAFVLQLLQKVETHQGVALQKLLVFHLCPYCSRKSNSLATKANKAVSEGNCPICHQILPSKPIPKAIGELRSQIAKLNKNQEQTSRKHESLQQEADNLNEREFELRAQLDDLTGKLPRIPKNAPPPDEDVTSMRRTLQIYQVKHAELETSWQKVKQELDSDFASFLESSAGRLQSLRDLASDYAHAFLGRECEFIAVRAKGELGAIDFFVPRFEGKDRASADACSESERFFLDIGFRMALLELAGRLSKSQSTFVCETPENALDLAYVDNVAKMFQRFMKNGRSLLLTANIQAIGVAEPLLSRYSARERRKRIFNLLEAGNLSEIQKEKLPDFKKELNRILGNR
jgi:hypothetical protein